MRFTERRRIVVLGDTTKMHLSRYRWLFFVLFYTVGANIPYWTACHGVGLLRLGWFCVEYAMVGVFALFAPSMLAASLLLLVMVADFLSGILLTYHVSITQCLANIAVYRSVSIKRQLAVMLFALLALLLTASAAPMRAMTVPKDSRGRVAACLIAFAVISLSVDGVWLYRATGAIPNPLRSQQSRLGKFGMNRYSALRLVRVPTARIFRGILTEIELREMIERDSQSPHRVESAAAQALLSGGFGPIANQPGEPNLVLILVESWGLPSSTSLRSALIKPYFQPKLLSRYKVTQGTAPFYGGTIAAEARELCGSSFGLFLMKASSSQLRDCLPQRMATMGYSDFAVHGMSDNMFDRSTWWKTIGFNDRSFNEQLQQQGLPNCLGAFIGTCDSSIAEWIGKRLANKEASPDFVYWVTLNSHLPVLVPSPLYSGAPCLTTLTLSPDTALCSWYQLVANVHQSVARLATSNLSRPTVFAIVGDHAPPFSDPQMSSQFSSTSVPFIVLTPRPGEALANSRSIARGSAQPTPVLHKAAMVQSSKSPTPGT